MFSKALFLMVLLVGSLGAADHDRKGPVLLPSPGDAQVIFPSSLSDGDLPELVIELPPLKADELAQWDAAKEKEPRIAGFYRPVPEVVLEFTDLQWLALPTGEWATAVKFVSPGADMLRVAFSFEVAPRDTRLVVQGSETTDRVTGDSWYAHELEEGSLAWAAALGDSLRMVLSLPGDQMPQAGRLIVSKVSHVLFSPPSSDISTQADGISQMSWCHVNPKCSRVEGVSWAELATFKLFVSGPQGDGMCTGALVNNKDQEYFAFTNNHCVSTQTQASGITTLWQYEAASCFPGVMQGVTMSGGARLLRTSEALDVTLLDLGRPPPGRPALLGWDPEPPRIGEVLMMVAHSGGGPKTLVMTQDFQVSPNPSNTAPVASSLVLSGYAEGGSSGAAKVDEWGYVRAVHWGGSQVPCVGSNQVLFSTPASEIERVFGNLLWPVSDTPWGGGGSTGGDGGSTGGGGVSTGGGGGSMSPFALVLILLGILARSTRLASLEVGTLRQGVGLWINGGRRGRANASIRLALGEPARSVPEINHR